ncbi:MAG: hypothetical protein UT75_C0009G0029 [Candidatus Yanofskybacteria bacterium GW2011_GWE2_40_11]|uniref:Uncharacterized protein n=1 Tax=Candidatus Yanofskybacteria bacterium GW2011_GWE2_40_11 TaxID=1619033 RepID=A0A0G0QSD8_9BACT|nr:MAG: hypothetical protein UT75_C0009G0029 [Candidatus Yanofskybacteria bacterium GW2011_GWE2_40_11]
MAKCSLVPVVMSEVIPEKVTDPVEKVGALLKTRRPEPVSSDMDKAALAEDIDVVNAPPVVVDTNLSAWLMLLLWW